MCTHYIIPTFNKSTPNKVHNDLVVTSQSTVTHPTSSRPRFFSKVLTTLLPDRSTIIDGAMYSAIASESIPATVDGEYIFVVRVDNIGQCARVMIGVTPMATFDSDTESFPGWNGMTGSALYLNDGNYQPGNNPNLIDSKIAHQASEVIVLVTIANNGTRKMIRWIVDGVSSSNHDCTAHCYGNKLFPVVSTFERDNQVATIAIDQVTIRNDEINKLIFAQPSFLAPTPLLMKEAFANNFPEQLALKLRGDTLHSVLFGLAGAGKSTVFNFINYVLRGKKFAGGRQTGESAVAGGQFSTQCFRQGCSFFLEWDVKQKGDLLITDTVGFKGDESEISAIGNGKLNDVEAWPRDNSEANNRKQLEILNRPPQTTRPTCFVLFISADQLMNKNDKASDTIVRSVIDAAKTMFNVGVYQDEIPLIVVISKVDKMESSPTKEDLLLQRTSPKLNPIFRACSQRYGVAQDGIFALGFLDETDITDFSSSTEDPGVLAVRHLLLSIAEAAGLCTKKFKQFEQLSSSSSPASPNQTAEKKKNGNDNDDDDQQEKQFAAVAAAYGCTNPVVTDVSDINHKSVSENGNVNDRTPTVDSITAADNEKEKQLAYFADKMCKAGSNKAYVETLGKDNLRALLICKNVAAAVVKAIYEGDYSGVDFVDDSFVVTVFDDETKKKYNINRMNMVSFNKIREDLIKEKTSPDPFVEQHFKQTSLFE